MHEKCDYIDLYIFYHGLKYNTFDTVCLGSMLFPMYMFFVCLLHSTSAHVVFRSSTSHDSLNFLSVHALPCTFATSYMYIIIIFLNLLGIL